MQSHYDEAFVRDMGCTVREWLGWLPDAVGDRRWTLAPGEAKVELATDAELHLHWRELPPRVIALMRMPRLEVQFRFHGGTAEERYAFMKRFDLYMQRGGG
jgi:hypothetical protein